MKKMNKKQTVALSSVFASFGLTAMKLVVGIITGSMGIVSEAAHSALDFVAALMTYLAVNIGDKPADKRHPYGHGKVESVSALLETCLLVLTSAWIIYEAVKRLIHGKSEVEVAWYSFAVIIVSIIVDLSRSRALAKVAKETKSQALEADALHFSSDILSSFVVLVGLIFVYFGNTTADSIAAIIVSFVVLYAAYELGRKTINVLVDTAPEGMIDQIEAAAIGVEGVIGVEKIRARAVGPSVIIDITVSLNRTNNLLLTQEICQKIEAEIQKDFPDSDITIHSKPLPVNGETISERVQMIAITRGLSAHNIVLHEDGTQKNLNFDLEVNGGINLVKAHKIASDLEKEIIAEFGDIKVNSHIEPLKPKIVVGQIVDEAKRIEIEDKISSIVKGFSMIKDIHDISITKNENRILVSFHCLFDGNLSIDDVHGATGKLENKIRESITEIAKVSVHAEPA